MTNKEIEQEIIKALDINTKVDWNWSELTPSQEFKELKKFVKKLFREE